MHLCRPMFGCISTRYHAMEIFDAVTPKTATCNASLQRCSDLQELTGELMSRHTAITMEGARFDIAANGFWGGRFERTFFDIRVFNFYASSNRQSSIDKCYRKHELEKKWAYEQRIREVEHSSFTPLVLSASGRLAKEATISYKRLASLLAEKWDEPYSCTMNWLRCTLSSSLLRSAIQCVHHCSGKYVYIETDYGSRWEVISSCAQYSLSEPRHRYKSVSVCQACAHTGSDVAVVSTGCIRYCSA